MELPAKRVAQVALALWVGSLCLPAITLRDEAWQGWFILVMGWGGLNLAWLSNFLFLKATIWVISRQPDAPVAAATWAAILSPDTLRFAEVPNWSGGPIPIFGYGSGAILWYLSLAASLVATGLWLRQ